MTGAKHTTIVQVSPTLFIILLALGNLIGRKQIGVDHLFNVINSLTVLAHPERSIVRHKHTPTSRRTVAVIRKQAVKDKHVNRCVRIALGYARLVCKLIH